MFSGLSFFVVLSNMNICELLVSVLVDMHFHLLAENSTKLDNTNAVFFLLPSPAQGYGSAWFGTAEIHGDPGLVGGGQVQQCELPPGRAGGNAFS